MLQRRVEYIRAARRTQTQLLRRPLIWDERENAGVVGVGLRWIVLARIQLMR
jgi:hypothetical protein